jgi:hypothetical protein
MRHMLGIVLPAVLLCGSCALAQEGAARFAGDWTKSDVADTTVTAFVQQIGPQSAGGPAGVHIVLGAVGGTLDVSAGPYLSAAIQQQLTAGSKVQVTGKLETVNGKQYLFAKQIVLNNQVVVVRTDRGSLVRSRTQARTQSQGLQNGGRS